jgi:hypothetical protein
VYAQLECTITTIMLNSFGVLSGEKAIYGGEGGKYYAVWWYIQRRLLCTGLLYRLYIYIKKNDFILKVQGNLEINKIPLIGRFQGGTSLERTRLGADFREP